MNAIPIVNCQFSRTSSISTLVMKGNNILVNQDSNSKKTLFKKWIFWAVIGYLLFIVLYIGAFVASEGENVLLSANELGDFLAGSFAPLAFLFLYLGYKMQGEELKQNTRALEKQAEELANSVAEQQRLITLHQEEKDARDFSVQPFLSFKARNFRLYIEPYETTDENDNPIEWVDIERSEYQLILKNEGEVAKNLSISNQNGIEIFNYYELVKDEEKILNWGLDDDEIAVLKTTNQFSKILNVKYYGTFGKEYLGSIEIKIMFYEFENEYAAYVNKIS
ncbi:hypothetical protein ACG904_00360 [Acinetobacter guillouiae]|uniref:hypothetical protein n=1 Tax=Acinetobacter guillouiae TaxID=106649 RepID=UPI003AF9137F